MIGCLYIAAGESCHQLAVETRLLPLRTDLPSPDHLEVPLCHLHALAVDIWKQAQKTRQADVRR